MNFFLQRAGRHFKYLGFPSLSKPNFLIGPFAIFRKMARTLNHLVNVEGYSKQTPLSKKKLKTAWSLHSCNLFQGLNFSPALHPLFKQYEG